MVKIDDQGRIIIPKEIRERKRLIDEVDIEEVKDGVKIIPKNTISWKKFFENKLKINWKNVRKLDLSDEDLDDVWM